MLLLNILIFMIYLPYSHRWAYWMAYLGHIQARTLVFFIRESDVTWHPVAGLLSLETGQNLWGRQGRPFIGGRWGHLEEWTGSHGKVQRPIWEHSRRGSKQKGKKFPVDHMLMELLYQCFRLEITQQAKHMFCSHTGGLNSTPVTIWFGINPALLGLTSKLKPKPQKPSTSWSGQCFPWDHSSLGYSVRGTFWWFA